MPRPRKTKLPVSLETVLRVALPKKRLEDRMKIFRVWARNNLAVKLWRQPTEEEFQDELQIWFQKPFTNLAHIDSVVGLLKNFIPHFSAANRKKRAQTAAAKRWSNKIKKSS